MKKSISTLLLLCAMCFAQGTLTDSRDGKTYKIVKIGTQTWMAENLNYEGEDSDIGTCQGNDPKNCQKYGRLYKWEYAMLACPDEWHLPDYDEWQTLFNLAGGDIAGQKLKARNGWEKWNCEWTTTDDRGRTTKNSKCNSDNYGFSALPSTSEGQSGLWWTASENYSGATAIVMIYNSENIRRNSYGKSQALSVRCLKGEGKLPANFIAKKVALETAEAAKKADKIAEAANPLITEITSEGTILRGSTLARKLAWLDRSADSRNTYIIEVNADENIAPYIFEYKGATNITVILRGDNENRTIRLSSHGTMFEVKENVTFILDSNITLRGHRRDEGTMVHIKGGTFIMNAGSTITDNIATKSNLYGAGVNMWSGTFELNGGTISNNATDFGGGVYINSGTFTMKDGSIFGNNANSGAGGVYVDNSGTFNITGGTISGNTANQGGGVYNNGTFTMNGGTISGNNVNKNGGGVYNSRTFNMKDGLITGNVAGEYGGGVHVEGYYGTFAKTGGAITGYNSDKANGNVVKDETGVIARRGNAVYAGEERRKEGTADQWTNFSTNNNKMGWDDTYEYTTEHLTEQTAEYVPEPAQISPPVQPTPRAKSRSRETQQPSEEYEQTSPVQYESPRKSAQPFSLNSISLSFYRPIITSFCDYKGQELRRNGLTAMIGFEGIDKNSLFGASLFVGGGALGNDIKEFILGFDVKKMFWIWRERIAVPISLALDYRYQNTDIENRLVATFIDEPKFLQEPGDYLDKERSMTRSNFEIAPSMDLQIFIGNKFSIYAGYMYRATYSGDWEITYKILGKDYEGKDGDDFKVPEEIDPLKNPKERIFGKPGTLRFGVKFH